MEYTVDHICSAFLRRILRRMKALGISQSELARRMKVSRPYISKVLRQDVTFSFATEYPPSRRRVAKRYPSRGAKLARALELDFFPELKEIKK